MANIIHFKTVEINSKVYFVGKKKKALHYPIRSISLVPEPKSLNRQVSQIIVLEIFWQ